jgi:hypothetical protein
MVVNLRSYIIDVTLVTSTTTNIIYITYHIHITVNQPTKHHVSQHHNTTTRVPFCFLRFFFQEKETSSYLV